MFTVIAFALASHVHAAVLPPKSNVRPLEQGSGMVKTVECKHGVCKF